MGHDVGADLQSACQEFSSWLAARTDLSPNTRRAYAADAASLSRYLDGNRPIAEIRSAELQHLLEGELATALAPASVRRRLIGLRMFFDWSTKCGLTPVDPMTGVQVRFRRQRSLPRALSAADASRLARQAQREWEDSACAVSLVNFVAVGLLLSAGLRAGEAVTIRMMDVGTEDGTIRILGKGLRERIVFVPHPRLRGAVRQLASMRDEPSATLLFSRRNTPLSAATLRARVKALASRASIAGPVTPHMLRHTAATQLLDRGADIRQVQRLLGHASLTTTEIYTHVSDEALRRVVTDADVLGLALSS